VEITQKHSHSEILCITSNSRAQSPPYQLFSFGPKAWHEEKGNELIEREAKDTAEIAGRAAVAKNRCMSINQSKPLL
jgi:hypothetical protein